MKDKLCFPIHRQDDRCKIVRVILSEKLLKIMCICLHYVILNREADNSDAQPAFRRLFITNFNEFCRNVV